MAICKYYLEGRCRYGNACRFEHRQGDQPVRAFGSGGSSGGGWQNSNQHSGNKDGNPLMTLANQLTPASIQADMSNSECPDWRLSCYSPIRSAPNLLDGADNLEMSFEEARMACYAASKPPGNFQDYERTMFMLMEKSEQRIRHLLSNLPAAISQMKQLCRTTDGTFNSSSTSNTFNTSSAFGSNNPTTNMNSAFGSNTNSAFGSNNYSSGQSSAFGGSSSNQSSAFTSTKKVTPTMGGGGGDLTPVFGQSAFGSSNNQNLNTANTGSAFGQSAFGNTNTNSSQYNNNNAFGSAFNQNTNQSTPMNSAFGTVNNPQAATTSAFGSAFGQVTPSTATTTSAFGQVTNNTSGFGTSTAPLANTGFGINTNSSSNNTLAESNQIIVPSILSSEYTVEDIEAFQSGNFVFGQIPELEPPPHLRMRQ
ncbi:hypothetical protein BDF22DRAFT_683060 [Syncephalis plumigaleata]|nr:hypothetical protein BDF22DRAFT_683060 [Syncephalis plumigaleata]